MEEPSKTIEQPQKNENKIPNSRYQNLYEEENSIEPHPKTKLLFKLYKKS